MSISLLYWENTTAFFYINLFILIWEELFMFYYLIVENPRFSLTTIKYKVITLLFPATLSKENKVFCEVLTTDIKIKSTCWYSDTIQFENIKKREKLAVQRSKLWTGNRFLVSISDSSQSDETIRLTVLNLAGSGQEKQPV